MKPFEKDKDYKLERRKYIIFYITEEKTDPRRGYWKWDVLIMLLPNENPYSAFSAIRWNKSKNGAEDKSSLKAHHGKAIRTATRKIPSDLQIYLLWIQDHDSWHGR